MLLLITAAALGALLRKGLRLAIVKTIILKTYAFSQTRQTLNSYGWLRQDCVNVSSPAGLGESQARTVVASL
jgi:hypothetical protein